MPATSSYSSLKQFTPYPTLEACVANGGRPLEKWPISLWHVASCVAGPTLGYKNGPQAK